MKTTSPRSLKSSSPTWLASPWAIGTAAAAVTAGTVVGVAWSRWHKERLAEAAFADALEIPITVDDIVEVIVLEPPLQASHAIPSLEALAAEILHDLPRVR